MNTRDMAAELNPKQLTRPGMTLREAILSHLSLYRPGAAGPSANDIGQILCAGIGSVEHELAVLAGKGTVYSGTITVLEGETVRWWLADALADQVHATDSIPAWLAYAGVPMEQIPEPLRPAVAAHRAETAGE